MASPSARSTACSPVYRIAFVTDVGGLPVDGDAYRGVTRAAAALSCGASELISSRRPQDYLSNLQAAAHRSDLVIAGSFLMADATVAAAESNRQTRFLLISPLVDLPSLPNLAALRLREDQGAYLAGALGAMLTKTGIVAGIYGPQGLIDQQQRHAFELGATHVRPGIHMLGAYQPSDTPPYGDPAWGSQQARAFAAQGADVIFGGQGQTGAGALSGAARSGRLCIGANVDSPPGANAPACLVGTTTSSLDAAVALEIERIAAGQWTAGPASLGIADGVVGFETFGAGLRPDIQRPLQAIAEELAAGTLSTGS